MKHGYAARWLFLRLRLARRIWLLRPCCGTVLGLLAGYKGVQDGRSRMCVHGRYGTTSRPRGVCT